MVALSCRERYLTERRHASYVRSDGQIMHLAINVPLDFCQASYRAGHTACATRVILYLPAR